MHSDGRPPVSNLLPGLLRINRIEIEHAEVMPNHFWDARAFNQCDGFRKGEVSGHTVAPPRFISSVNGQQSEIRLVLLD
jgi:hypothetical protein